MTARTTIIFEIAETIDNFKAEEVDGKWRVRDRKAGVYVVADYANEAMARAGASMAAACEIFTLLEGARS